MDRSDLKSNFGFLMHDIARLMKAEFDRRGRELGLTRSQWWVLNFVYAKEGATQTELADICEVERATMGRLLDKLEEKGWVRRTDDPDDRRIRRVWLTGEVQDMMAGLRKVAAEVRADAMQGISKEDQEKFVEILCRIKGNLTGEQIDLQPDVLAGKPAIEEPVEEKKALSAGGALR